MKQWLMFMMSFLTSCRGLDNGLATTPPMGWTTGNRFLCEADCHTYPFDCINERLINSTAAAIRKTFQKRLEYVHIGAACWSSGRNMAGYLKPDVSRFPSGIRILADQLHAQGLKLGLYLSYGKMTNDKYLQQDAQQMATWGVDMVTLDVDLSVKDPKVINKVFPAMASYLNQTGRQILLSCVWPVYLRKLGNQPNFDIIRKTCNIYQTFDNAEDSWVALLDATKFVADFSPQVANYTGAGSWNYNFYTLLGNYGLSLNQQQYQLAIWTIMANPLFVSGDLRRMLTDQRQLLLNDLLYDIIRNNSGIAGKQKMILQSNGQVRVWVRHVEPAGSLLLALTYENISGGPAKVAMKFTDLNLPLPGAFYITDVFTGQKSCLTKPWFTYNAEVNPTGAKLLYLTAAGSK